MRGERQPSFDGEGVPGLGPRSYTVLFCSNIPFS
jgi:hypothetical protein